MRLFWVVLASVGLWGQHAHPAAVKNGGGAARLPETGDYTFRIQSSVPLAQKYFDAGLAVLRESLARQARDGRVLFLLWKTLAAAGREREAALVEREFRAVWKGGAYLLRVEEL